MADRFPRAALAFVLGLAAATILSGCPRQPNAPEPGMGTPCEQLSDCNPGVSCGEMRLCVDGFCEEGASLVRPCRGAGDPIRPPGRM